MGVRTEGRLRGCGEEPLRAAGSSGAGWGKQGGLRLATPPPRSSRCPAGVGPTATGDEKRCASQGRGDLAANGKGRGLTAQHTGPSSLLPSLCYGRLARKSSLQVWRPSGTAEALLTSRPVSPPALPARVPGGQRAPPTQGRSDPDPSKVLQVVVAEPALEPSLCHSRPPECSRGTVAPPHYGDIRNRQLSAQQYWAFLS